MRQWLCHLLRQTAANSYETNQLRHSVGTSFFLISDHCHRSNVYTYVSAHFSLGITMNLSSIPRMNPSLCMSPLSH